MTSKVLLFETSQYLYCSDLKFKDDKYTGYVENGAWYLEYDISTSTLKCFRLNNDKIPILEINTSLVWMNDPIKGDYNTVIENAKHQITDGEPSNWVLEEHIQDTYDNEIPF
jgi:hypothetical protein